MIEERTAADIERINGIDLRRVVLKAMNNTDTLEAREAAAQAILGNPDNLAALEDWYQTYLCQARQERAAALARMRAHWNSPEIRRQEAVRLGEMDYALLNHFVDRLIQDAVEYHSIPPHNPFSRENHADAMNQAEWDGAA